MAATVSVAELCEDKGLTLKELANRSQLDELRVTAIVMGRWTPSPEERSAVASALGVEVNEISWGHKTPIQHIYGHGPG